MPEQWTDQGIRERNERVFGAPVAAPLKPKRRKVTSEAEIAKVCTQVSPKREL